MTTMETMPEKEKWSTLDVMKQDFFQEAKNLIAEHENIKENKVQGTSINVFKNKHQKPKSIKYIPLDVKKKEVLDVVHEHQKALRNICPKELPKSEHVEETSQRTCFKKPQLLSIKEKLESTAHSTEEQVKLGKIVTDIDSVSKKMEKEKQNLENSRFLASLYDLPAYFGLPLPPGTSSMGLLKERDKAFYDWRGIVSIRSVYLAPDSSRVNFPGPLETFQGYHMKQFMKRKQKLIKPEPKSELRLKSIPDKIDKVDSKVKRIGPHIEIFQVFREKNKFLMSKKMVKMITTMQAHVRGWLERRRFQRIMTKALFHGSNLRAVINMYRAMIHRVRYRLGLWRTRQVINLAELEEWMDRKKYYETMFAKREDWQGLDRNELLKYFNDCGHFPTQAQIDDTWDLVHRSNQEKYSRVIKKFNAIEMLFTLYPPKGVQISNNVRLRSTWLRPIVNGEEGYKYIVSGHPVLKRANIRVVGKLVAASIRERKTKLHYKS
nr:IQ domain-containing protein M isoform X1 [Oryctolagus cuniculus]XP_051675321.1 IQ domain-containing protein M isoform X1 [Oryctolagus cuniculus]XP_051675322.1 IQ domain-containing protein M isoform X1 [Oryctolagus cuniculus]XP_051675323.1 IQ domain-containing protein M isoform X1 [Oryctolagus cuniculus]XP_051675324.1 IQ domain-containing protein M isoform X1 [Oryctolagus cuniculus]XP_051675325.1 IQ domain-containing protein M isoform X1 [Oryctolagus cuniculus]XP_051675326.1 IQ domain-cont